MFLYQSGSLMHNVLEFACNYLNEFLRRIPKEKNFMLMISSWLVERWDKLMIYKRKNKARKYSKDYVHVWRERIL